MLTQAPFAQRTWMGFMLGGSSFGQGRQWARARSVDARSGDAAWRCRSRRSRCVIGGARRQRGCLLRMAADVPASPSPSSDAPLSPVPEGVEKDNATVDNRFRLWRYRVFFGLYISYVIYSITRSTFTFVSPTFQRNGMLTLAEIGAVASTFPVAYGLSKLVTGVIADHSSPRVVLGSGMALTGAANLGLALATGVRGFSVMWGLNGLVQGVGAGAVAKTLTQWYTRKERGFWWAFWSTSANLGGFVAPILCGWLVSNQGWQQGVVVPGLIALIGGVLLIPLLRDTPEELGFVLKHEEKSGKKESEDEKRSFWELLVQNVLLNRALWFLALSNFFVYFVRSGLRSWHHFYFADLRGLGTAEAAYRVSGMEIGGLLGTLSSGVISDKVKGSRVPVICLYLLGLIGTLALSYTSSSTSVLLDLVTVGALGFFINGPQCLIGLIGAETVDRRAVATVTGVLGWISYLGAAVAGFPISLAVKSFGWSAYIVLLGISAASSAVFLLPLWRLDGTAHSPSQIASEQAR